MRVGARDEFRTAVRPGNQSPAVKEHDVARDTPALQRHPPSTLGCQTVQFVPVARDRDTRRAVRRGGQSRQRSRRPNGVSAVSRGH